MTFVSHGDNVYRVDCWKKKDPEGHEHLEIHRSFTEVCYPVFWGVRACFPPPPSVAFSLGRLNPHTWT